MRSPPRRRRARASAAHALRGFGELIADVAAFDLARLVEAAMTQDLARIRAFVQVFDSGGFSAAARQHGRSKALLSKYVTDLEDYLGVRLMNRTTRKLSLTEAGEAYYREASQLLQQFDDLDAAISDQTTAPRGLIRVSAPRNLGESTLAPAIFDFLAKHPQVSVDLRLEDRYVDLVDEGIDLALRISQPLGFIADRAEDRGHERHLRRVAVADQGARHAQDAGGAAADARASSTPTSRARPTGGSSRTARPSRSTSTGRCG